VLYQLRRGTATPTETQYLDSQQKVFPKGMKIVEALVVKEEGPDGPREATFKADRATRRYVEEVGPRYMTDEQLGWIYTPQRGLAWAVAAINLAHLLVWFLALWLLLRFQWGHALGLAFVLWIAMTLVIVPMLLDRTPRKADSTKQSATPVSLVDTSRRSAASVSPSTAQR
jgi:hypothetical protein